MADTNPPEEAAEGALSKHFSHLQAFVELAAQRRKVTNRDITSCLVIYASGGIGAKGDSMDIVRGHLKKLVMGNNFFCDKEFSNGHPGWIVTPPFMSKCRVKYQITEFDQIINSANADIQQAKKIGRLINDKYKEYDAFIVLVGLDTSCYMASLLSFMFSNLSKMILFTGATIPLCYMRNDAFNNLLDSLAVVAEFEIYQVVILNKFQVYRGNRASKVFEGRFDTIGSPNFPSLMEIKIDFSTNDGNIALREKYLLPKPTKEMEYFDQFCSDVKVIVYHPMLTLKTLQYELNDPTVKAIVVQSYSSANLPMREEVLQLFKAASDRGLFIVNISQCTYYTNASSASRRLEQYGVYYAGNMTTEATLAKLAFMLGKNYSREELARGVRTDMHGELSQHTQQKTSMVFQRPPESFMQILEEVLPRRLQKNKILIEKSIVPALVKELGRSYSDEQLRAVLSIHTQMTDDYYHIPELLHIATRQNNAALIQHLLSKDIDVNVLDSRGCSPMFYSLSNVNKLSTYSLMKQGGKVVSPDDLLMQLFIDKIKEDNKDFLELAYHTGFQKEDLEELLDEQERCIAHYCVIFKAQNCLAFLRSKEVRFNMQLKDVYGNSVAEQAKRLNVVLPGL